MSVNEFRTGGPLKPSDLNIDLRWAADEIMGKVLRKAAPENSKLNIYIRPTSGLRIKLKLAVILIVLLFASGCGLFSVFTPTQIVKHPDAPMLIIEQNGEWVHVSAYSKSRNAMVDVGWVKPEKGWTLIKYDWERVIAKRRAELDN